MLPVFYKRKTVLKRLQALGGLTFAKNYARYPGSSSNADYAVGSKIATYTASRSATNPATYIDSAGVIQLVTTSDIPRFDAGYYDATGFHLTDSNSRRVRGLVIEAAGTNLLLHSYFDVDTNVDGVADSWGSEIAGVTASIETSPIFGNAQKFVLDGTEGNYYQAEQTINVSISTVYTLSFFVKSSAWNGSERRYLEISGNGGFTSIFEVFSTSNYTTDWIKVTQSFTTTGTQTTVSLKLARESTGGTTGTIWFSCIQLEAAPYATSFIPTTTAALTRNAEVLKYEIANNRTAAQESIFIKFAPYWSSALKGNIPNYLIGTDTKNRAMLSGWSDGSIFYVNSTDSPACVAPISENSMGNALNTSVVVAGVLQHTSPYASFYKNGSLLGSAETTDDFINPAWGTNFYVGSYTDGTLQLDGTIQAVAIFNRALSASEVLVATNLVNALE